MTLRSQAIAALAVLFVTLGVVFVATDSIGVNTDVFLPDQPTPTPIPPTPTPLPVASADNWVAVGPGQYQYFGDIGATAEITVLEGDYASFLTTSGLVAPPDDAPYPLMDLLGQVRDDIDGEIEGMGLQDSPDAVTGPVIELIGGVPVTMLHFELDQQPTASGFDFPGIDLAYAWFMRGEDELVRVGLYYEASPNATMYADFRAWLEANVPELAQADEASDADADVEAETDAEPNVDAEVETEAETDAEADAEAETDAETEADAEADVEVETEAETDAEANADAEVETEADADVSEDTDAEADAETEPEAESEADTAQADPNTTEEAEVTAAVDPNAGPWVLLQEGVYLHSIETNAQIQTYRDTRENLAMQIGYTSEDGTTSEGILAFVAESNRAQIEEMADQIEVIEFEGPETMDVAGVTVHYIRFVIFVTTEETSAGQETFLGLIDVDDEVTNTVSYQYGYQTEANPTVSADFFQWLEDNIETLSTPVEGE